MKQVTITKNQRINVMLPAETLHLLNSLIKAGERSKFIDTAINHYIESVGQENLAKQIKEGAKVRAKRDLQLAEEWFQLDD